MKIGEYYKYKKETTNYSSELEECIEKTCQYCIDNTIGNGVEVQKDPIMMLGKIQSGKTRAFTGLIALAFDNNFDIVFVLTKNSKALVKQTEMRMKKEFEPFTNSQAGKGYNLIVKDIVKTNINLTGYELDKKMIIIAKKEKKNLERITKFIEENSISKGKKCIIIDDEADTTGIGYEKNKNTDGFDLRTVAASVNKMRGDLNNCVFVQVTATPYSLYLQPEYFQNEVIKPVKPRDTVLVPSGDGYIGGDYYFIKSQEEVHNARFIFKPVSESEHEIISDQKRKGKKSKLSDKRVFKKEDILKDESAIPTFKMGIMNFIVGAILLRINNNSDNFYSYAIHTATQKSNHQDIKEIVEIFLNEIKVRTNKTKPFIDKLLYNSYNDLCESVAAYGYVKPTYDIVEEEFYKLIDKGYYSIDLVNSDNDIDELLTETTGELNLKAPFSIFVGGQVLDRGVTIPNMMGFYYGRNPKSMQQDTVLQHSRMFGYRPKELLSVTRFYTTSRIHDNMTKITEIDIELREDIEQGKMGNGVYFITKRDEDDQYGISGKIIPCSPDKIKVSDLILLKPHKRTLPIGFTPIVKSKYEKLNNDIENILRPFQKERNLFVGELNLNDAEDLVKLVYGTIVKDQDSNRFVSCDEFLTTMKYMLDKKQSIKLIVNKDKNNKKYRANGRYEDAPDSGQNELQKAKTLAIDEPVIILLQENGKSEDWKNRSFWWPVLVSQKNISKVIYASNITKDI